MIPLRFVAVSTIGLALLVLTIEVSASVFFLPGIAASIEQSKREGDPEVRNIDVAAWKRMALLGSWIAGGLSVAFIVSGVGLLYKRNWARTLFVAGSIGVLAFMVAGFIHYPSPLESVHVGYGLALLSLGWWYLYRSRAAAAF